MEELDRVSDLIEQGLDLRSIIDVAVGQEGGDDPAGHRVEADMQLAPGAPLAGAVFLDQPFARPAQLQAGTIDHQVDRPTVARGCAGSSRFWARRLRVEKSGTDRSRPNRWRMEPISPSVWRSGRRNTARNVKAVVIARSE